VRKKSRHFNLGVEREVLGGLARGYGGGAGEKQVPRLRRMIRFANRSAALGMTDFYCGEEFTARLKPRPFKTGGDCGNWPTTTS
jgi:hypothetical protein